MARIVKLGNDQDGGGIYPAALLDCGHIVRDESFKVGQDMRCPSCESHEHVPYDEVDPIGAPINRDELLATLKRLQASDMGDGHGEADSALLDYINDVEIRKAFLAVGRYYD